MKNTTSSTTTSFNNTTTNTTTTNTTCSTIMNTFVHAHNIFKEFIMNDIHIPTPLLLNSLFIDLKCLNSNHNNTMIIRNRITTSNDNDNNMMMILCVKDFEEFLRTLLRKYIHPLWRDSSGFIIMNHVEMNDQHLNKTTTTTSSSSSSSNNNNSTTNIATTTTSTTITTTHRMYQFNHPQLTNLLELLNMNYYTNHLKTTQKNCFNMYRMNSQWCMELIERFKSENNDIKKFKSENEHHHLESIKKFKSEMNNYCNQNEYHHYLEESIKSDCESIWNNSNHFTYSLCNTTMTTNHPFQISQECVNTVVLETIQYFEELCQRSLFIFRECLKCSGDENGGENDQNDSQYFK
ncbi:hypothetical protein FDP41_006725 [Naegleria fowleri]|uniref:Uncharacterized protein n=1 Tax=Naegleria fowleri TaxID=5763 RepID=A0A6A5BIS2_NAEFO|nr:uncharacterized protein FDP41_007032 [Naegleria fowleri]XP_044558828.1 uncharacterized protein FDP41_006725 [Naegleria fowleri]KAF0973948.1 hypothetical protein FDP41_007032 [Naegleria fowleri]KAF0974115.1 hypothetical protein FDP41_006725 [Naegleria fowleri]